MAEYRHARPRDRLRAFLCGVYGYGGDNRDKRLARELAAVGAGRMTDRAARNLFEGHWPGDETWAAIVRRFGEDVLRAVFAPEIDPVLAEMHEREARLARELEGLRARRREVQGFAERRAFGLDDDQDQAGPQVVRDLFDDGARS